MRGAALPAALLCAALGLMLAFAPRRALLPAFVLLALSAAFASSIAVEGHAVEVAFIGCWVSVIALAAAVHLPRGVPLWLALAAAVDAGIWSGAVISGEGTRLDLLRALPAVLVILIGRWCVGRGWPIPVKIVSSWLIAVALLAALLPTAATPGYAPDHMD